MSNDAKGEPEVPAVAGNRFGLALGQIDIPRYASSPQGKPKLPTGRPFLHGNRHGWLDHPGTSRCGEGRLAGFPTAGAAQTEAYRIVVISPALRQATTPPRRTGR